MMVSNGEATALADPGDPCLRRTGIGGSDASKIAGVNPWETELDCYLEKIGAVTKGPAGEAAEMGVFLEPAVLLLYARKSGRVVLGRDLFGRPVLYLPSGEVDQEPPAEAPVHLLDTLRHQGHDYVMCHLDGVAFREEGDWEPVRWVESKTASLWLADQWGAEGTDDVPPQYFVQSQHNGMVAGSATGLDRPTDVPALIGGQKYRSYTVDQDPSFHGDLLRLEEEFWRRVEERDPPPAEPSEAGAKALARLYPEDDGDERIIAPVSHVHGLALDAARAKAAVDEAEARKTAAYNALREEHGETRRLIGDGWKSHWYTVRPKPETDWEAVARGLIDLPAEKRDEPRFRALVEEHTTTRPSYRTFRPDFKHLEV